MRPAVCAVLALLVLAGCDSAGEGPRAARERGFTYPAAPETNDGPLPPRLDRATATLMRAATAGGVDEDALEVVSGSGDARLAWYVSDLLRFVQGGEGEEDLVAAFERLTAIDPRADPEFTESPWSSVTNHLIAWDLPAPPAYRERKSILFLSVEPGWEPFFADAGSEIDWRLVSWGGVAIDDRPAGATEPCRSGCIPALDDPELTAADEGDWFPDEGMVFGVVVGGEAVAFPKNIMEVHEMVNVTIGGRRLGIPYCTLCGSAQAYLLDSVPSGIEQPVLRTSGLLSRSNKVMYDLRSRSVLDTFSGRALSGPLHEARVELRQASVVVSTWGEWRDAHPDTRIVAEDGGIGRSYPDDPLGGRDEDGPIFPVGDVDPRLAVQEQVAGVIAPGGGAVAFSAAQARRALAEGERVEASGVELTADGGGLRARNADGRELVVHQAFWFAWSQFHPGTRVWSPGR